MNSEGSPVRQSIESGNTAALEDTTSDEVSVDNPDSRSARTLAAMCRECSCSGGCPYTLDQLVRALRALKAHGYGRMAATIELADHSGLPAGVVYGCVLELKDYGLARWAQEPIPTPDDAAAEITADGVRFLREIDVRRRGGR